MASDKHSKTMKTRKCVKAREPIVASERSEWAAWMNGADHEWLYGAEALVLAEAFNGRFPAWLIASEPWRKVSPIAFKTMRKDLLGMNQAQCAVFLRVSKATVSNWERGRQDVPFAACEVLRMLVSSNSQKLSHDRWDGWFVCRATGALVSPDVGRLAVQPGEINALPHLYSRIALQEQTIAEKQAVIDALAAQNTALRNGKESRQLTKDLEDMQMRISKLLASVRTAEIIEFNRPDAALLCA